MASTGPANRKCNYLSLFLRNPEDTDGQTCHSDQEDQEVCHFLRRNWYLFEERSNISQKSTAPPHPVLEITTYRVLTPIRKEHQFWRSFLIVRQNWRSFCHCARISQMRFAFTSLDFTNRSATLKNLLVDPEISFSRPHLALLQYYLHSSSWSLMC